MTKQDANVKDLEQVGERDRLVYLTPTSEMTELQLRMCLTELRKERIQQLEEFRQMHDNRG